MKIEEMRLNALLDAVVVPENKDLKKRLLMHTLFSGKNVVTTFFYRYAPLFSVACLAVGFFVGGTVKDKPFELTEKTTYVSYMEDILYMNTLFSYIPETLEF